MGSCQDPSISDDWPTAQMRLVQKLRFQLHLPWMFFNGGFFTPNNTRCQWTMNRICWQWLKQNGIRINIFNFLELEIGVENSFKLTELQKNHNNLYFVSKLWVFKTQTVNNLNKCEPLYSSSVEIVTILIQAKAF